MKTRFLLQLILAVLLYQSILSIARSQEPYPELIKDSGPVAYWDFESTAPAISDTDLAVATQGATRQVPGPRPESYPLFQLTNTALDLGTSPAYLRLKDPGTNSLFDFDKEDEISIEAWVAPLSLKPGGYSYVIGKGRTYLGGKKLENHNWAMRLKGTNSGAALTFLFRSSGKSGEYHRWTSNTTFAVGDGWHHVALTYRFGKSDSLRGYIDGEPVKGKWDLGGATNRSPVVDNDEVWIGSAMGGAAGSSFQGALDEIALYRRILSRNEVKSRFRYVPPPVPAVEVPTNSILVQVFSNVPNSKHWNWRPPKLLEEFTQSTFAFPELPNRYSERGVKVDWPTPLLVRAHADIRIPKGKHRVLIRGREASRLFLDDELVAETPFYSITIEANGPIWDLDRSHAPNIRPLPRGDRQAVYELEGDGEIHRFRFETLAGLNKRRPELGEASVSLAKGSGDFSIIGFSLPHRLTNEGWLQFEDYHREWLEAENRKRKNVASKQELEFWQKRHEKARRHVESKHLPSGSIDKFLNAQLAEQGLQPTQPIDDLTFLRRLSFDTIGRLPDLTLVDQYLATPASERRQFAIDQLLEHPEWADHWVSYWQDVLAENPNVVNPSLNNTGPFRWWIREAFADNMPFDRFVTELIRMEGSQYFGGPGGFKLATENDVPMAAKAHILGQAFLGIQMQCARCHDAPAHDVTQRDLFSMAAMLEGKPLSVPVTSSINLPNEEIEQMAVAVTLEPGEKVEPEWRLNRLLGTAESTSEVLTNDKNSAVDSREKLAELITAPSNDRFAQVIANRLWRRYMGRGIVEPVNDWEQVKFTHSALMNWLGDELVANSYDLKHLARLIFESEAYGRGCVEADDPRASYFAGPVLQPLSAEQLVDSLFAFSQKRFNAGQMAIDIDGVRPPNLSLNLGTPRRAWMFGSTSNERDRPGLAMPFVQPFVTFLKQFGWTGTRQGPINYRSEEVTAGQPAEFANGLLVQRATRLSDDHAFTVLAVESEQTLELLVDRLFLASLTRYPTPEEKALITEVLEVGYSDRIVDDAKPNPNQFDRRGTVSWSVHLEKEASEIKAELQEVVRRGDIPTNLLTRDWRERLEDVIWSLLNSPEFRFRP